MVESKAGLQWPRLPACGRSRRLGVRGRLLRIFRLSSGGPWVMLPQTATNSRPIDATQFCSVVGFLASSYALTTRTSQVCPLVGVLHHTSNSAPTTTKASKPFLSKSKLGYAEGRGCPVADAAICHGSAPFCHGSSGLGRSTHEGFGLRRP